jgi:O-antigen/teichoic acid export membrane protein
LKKYLPPFSPPGQGGQMNPFKKLAGQTAIYGLPTIIGRLLNSFLVPLYTINFPPAEYGTVNEMYAYVSFLIIILTYGMETALFNFSRLQNDPDGTRKQKVYSTILTSIIISSGIFIAALIIFNQPIANLIRYPDHPEYITWFALILGMDAVSAIAFAKLREQNKAKTFSTIKTLWIGMNVVLNLFFIIFCPRVLHHPDSFLYGFIQKIYSPEIGIGYIFISNLIASAVTLLVQLPSILRTRFSFDFSLFKAILPYAFPLLIAGLAGMTNETMDRILLKYLLPADIALVQVGIYGACYKISIIMTMFVQTFRYAAEPFFFSHAKEQNATKMYAQVMNYFVIV